jgi:hypothetical protein
MLGSNLADLGLADAVGGAGDVHESSARHIARA